MSEKTEIVAITGVSQGIGRAMAETLATAGHTVCGCARRAEPLEALGARCGPPSRFEPVDVTDCDAVERWAAAVIAEVGVPHRVIANAALINAKAPLWEVPPDELSRVVDVNVKGVYHTLRAFLPPMIAAGRGVVVALSSGWGRHTAPDVAPYCATKYAVEGMIGSLSQELPAGMAAVALNPGIIHTPMLERVWGDGAAQFPTPTAWAATAVPFILGLGPADNGQPLSAP